MAARPPELGDCLAVVLGGRHGDLPEPGSGERPAASRRRRLVTQVSGGVIRPGDAVAAMPE